MGRDWRVRPDLLLAADRLGIEGRLDTATRAERAELLNELLQDKQGPQGPANED